MCKCVIVSGVQQLREVHVFLKDERKLLREQLMEADAIMRVNPAFTCPIVALRSAGRKEKSRVFEPKSRSLSVSLKKNRPVFSHMWKLSVGIYNPQTIRC